MHSLTQLQAFKTTFIVALCILAIGFLYMFTNVTVMTTDEITEDQIVYENDNSYLLLDDFKLKISEGSLQHFDFEEDYTYEVMYSYNKLLPKKGKVMRIEVYGGPLPK